VDCNLLFESIKGAADDAQRLLVLFMIAAAFENNEPLIVIIDYFN
jgi:hypothetical protein